MEQLIATIEKGQPFFNAIARNKYLKAIRDGFISVIPIIIFSSIFCLVASVPNIWGFYWPDDINNALWKCYNYSMGILAIACAATTAKHFADAQNRDLPKNNQINFISCMCAAIIGFLLLSSDTIATDAASGFNTTYLGSKGLLTAFIAAFVTGIIYKFFIKRNITVKMPEQVPPNISQTFKDIIPFSVCITVFWVFDIVFRAAFGFCFAQGVIQVFQPLFTAADGYIGLAVIYGAMSLFWFVGVHGPSIVEPAIAAALVANMTDNLAAFQAGQHASAVLTQGAQYFVVCMGGTGATLVLVFMFCFLAKSQEMRAVGKAAIVPVCFAVNEPLLFAAPIVLNPVFFVPFVFAPIANIWILKIFIDFLGMNGFMYTLPWTVPGPIGTIMGLGFQPLAFVMLALILVVDFALYYPFFRAYDAQKCAEEAEISQEELAAKNAEKAAKLNDAFQGKADAKSVAAGKVLNDGSTMVAAQCSMLLLAVTQFTTKFNGSELSVFDCTSMGTRGLFSAYIAAFITVWVYKFCVSRDLTIKLPKEVPGAIAQNFRDIIPFGGAVIICGIIDVVVRNLMGVPFSELLIKLLSPLFTAAETYPGLILIQAATAFFWFIGVHGPSIVQPGIDPIRLANQAENLQVLLAGGHPAHSLTFNMSLVGEFGGTGATFIVPLLLILFMKSKQLKAVGKASIVPVAFAVNEPLLFGAPMILNPYMLIPFVAAGCVNVSVAKFFIDNVGMNGFSFVVPWATPAPIGIFITTNFQLIALVFVAIIILLDAIIYLPFLKAYDKLLCDQEAERAAELGLESDGAAAIAANASAPAVEQATASVETTVAAADSKPVADQPEPAADASAKKDVDGLKVLVLCAGAGTSAMLANAIKEGAAQTGENIASSAGAYGQHTAIMDQYDVIVLAPQVRSYYNDMKADTDRLGIKLLAPRGKEYIDLTRDPAGAIKWLRENLD